MVLAAGATTRADVPPWLGGCPPRIASVTRARTTATPTSCPEAACWSWARRPAGVQIADELQRSGRPVTLAVGEHVRVPRTLPRPGHLLVAGRVGILDERWDEVDDLVRARRLPSLQLVGASAPHARPERAAGGRRPAGRPVRRRSRDGVAQFSGVAAQRVRARRPQAGTAARHDRRARRRSGGERLEPHRSSGGRPWASTCAPARSARSSGPPASGPTSRGSTCPSSTTAAGSCTTAASRAGPASTCSACPCCAGVGRRTSTGPRADAADLAAHLAATSTRWRAPERRHREPPSPGLAIAAAVAGPGRAGLGRRTSPTSVRLRALLPGGPIEEHGRDAVLARFADWFGEHRHRRPGGRRPAKASATGCSCTTG